MGTTHYSSQRWSLLACTSFGTAKAHVHTNICMNTNVTYGLQSVDKDEGTFTVFVELTCMLIIS